MILPPTPAPPVKDGFTRHQYLLALSRNDYIKLIETNQLRDVLIENFGIVGATIAERVRDCENWVIYHLWVDQENA